MRFQPDVLDVSTIARSVDDDRVDALDGDVRILLDATDGEVLDVVADGPLAYEKSNRVRPFRVVRIWSDDPLVEVLLYLRQHLGLEPMLLDCEVCEGTTTHWSIGVGRNENHRVWVDPYDRGGGPPTHRSQSYRCEVCNNVQLVLQAS